MPYVRRSFDNRQQKRRRAKLKMGVSQFRTWKSRTHGRKKHVHVKPSQQRAYLSTIYSEYNLGGSILLAAVFRYCGRGTTTLIANRVTTCTILQINATPA